MCVALRPDSKSGTLEPRPLAFAELSGRLERRGDCLAFPKISTGKKVLLPTEKYGGVVPCTEEGDSGLGGPQNKNLMPMILGHMLCRFV